MKRVKRSFCLEHDLRHPDPHGWLERPDPPVHDSLRGIPICLVVELRYVPKQEAPWRPEGEEGEGGVSLVGSSEFIVRSQNNYVRGLVNVRTVFRTIAKLVL